MVDKQSAAKMVPEAIRQSRYKSKQIFHIKSPTKYNPFYGTILPGIICGADILNYLAAIVK